MESLKEEIIRLQLVGGSPNWTGVTGGEGVSDEVVMMKRIRAGPYGDWK